MRYDFAIAGAGPAGLTAAVLLARAGANVAVLDRPHRTPRRPGETLPGAGLRLLRSLGLPLPKETAGHRPLTGIASAWDGQRLVATDYFASPDGNSWLIDRDTFDEALRNEARSSGVKMIAAADTAPQGQIQDWLVTHGDGQIGADFLVDAGGRAARLAIALGARRSPSSPEMAWWTIVNGAAPPQLLRPLIERQDEGWWFALALDATRTYVAFHSNQRMGSPAERSLLWHSRLEATTWIGPFVAKAGCAGRVRGCQAGDSHLDRPVGTGWAACGDAAIAHDPISSQGLLSAMAGGHMLAASLTATGMSRDAAVSAYAERIATIWSIYAVRRTSMMAA